MPLATYRKVLEQMWTNKLLAGEHLASLVQLQGQLGITAEDAETTEREVMGMTKAEAMVSGITSPTPPPPVPTSKSSEALGETTHAEGDLSGATYLPPGSGAGSVPASDGAEQDLEGATLTPGPLAIHTDTDEFTAGMQLGQGDRYGLLDKIGEGGMGTVWRAKDLALDGRIVAMKRIRLFDEADRQMAQRFAQERQTIAGLNHSNVVTVYDAGDDQYGPYLVMEFVEGEPLDKLIKREALPESRAAEIVEGLCRGVAHAHKKGVIHRDIKPANVIVNTDGVPKLLDFGLARGNSGMELSMSGYGMGTLDYAAPEQKLDAKSVDQRADIYSLGMTFYELLTGLKPVPLHLPKVPERWQLIVGRACEPNPADRYQSADDLIQAVTDARTASLTDLALEVNTGGDDLRCPACKRINALDARVCRGCGENLLGECPACTETLRVGLLHCDKCGAAVRAVRVAKSYSSSATSALKSKQPQVAMQEAQAGLDALENARLGAASSLQSDLERLHTQAADLSGKVEDLVHQGREFAANVNPGSALECLREAVGLVPSLMGEYGDDMKFWEFCQALLQSMDLEGCPASTVVDSGFRNRSGQLETLLSAVGGALWVQATDSESAKRAEEGLGAFLRNLSDTGLKESAENQVRSLAEELCAKAREAGEFREAAEVAEAAEAAEHLNPFGWEILDATPGAGGYARKVHDPVSDVTFVLIDPGEFMMGSPETEGSRVKDERAHLVKLTRPYYLGETPVTQEQWARCIKGAERKQKGLLGFFQRGLPLNPFWFSGTKSPAENVNWTEAKRYCQNLSERTSGVAYRLPTEAEWEFACRAGTTTSHSCGAGAAGLDDVAWYVENSAHRTHSVKGKAANAFGLHDMHGNVSEWCSDWYGAYQEGTSVNPNGPDTGASRVLRGGCFISPAASLGSAERDRKLPSSRRWNIGFRVLAVIHPSSDPKAEEGG
jgi:formylglycine-generating enzyme required for sulfatase activity